MNIEPELPDRAVEQYWRCCKIVKGTLVNVHVATCKARSMGAPYRVHTVLTSAVVEGIVARTLHLHTRPYW